MPRGAYSGALGYFSIDGAADLNVVIRTAKLDAEGLSIGAGGAITVLSNPQEEWKEVLLKARNVVRAVAQCVCGRADAYSIGEAPPRPLPPPSQPPSMGKGGGGGKAPAATTALVETYLHTPSEGFFLWRAHLDRLTHSAVALGFIKDEEGEGAVGAGGGGGAVINIDAARAKLGARLKAELDACAASWPKDESSRVRLLMGPTGELQIARAPLASGVISHAWLLPYADG